MGRGEAQEHTPRLCFATHAGVVVQVPGTTCVGGAALPVRVSVRALKLSRPQEVSLRLHFPPHF